MIARPQRLLRWALCCLFMGALLAQDAGSLKAQHAALRDPLAHNPFQRPLHLQSRERSGALQGDIYAVLDQPFSVVGPALQHMANWCDILILHQNVKYCRAATATAQTPDILKLHIGRKIEQALADTSVFAFVYQVTATQADYLEIALNTEEGPFGTSQYRIVLEVVALDDQHSFLHLSFAYTYGLLARLAMQGYLATIGYDKVGFSVIRHQADGQPVYMGGIRGAVERNTMRYYLAIEAYLGALASPAPTQLEKRLNDWFTAVERYPRQLHEIERSEYLGMKQREVLRQQQGR